MQTKKISIYEPTHDSSIGWPVWGLMPVSANFMVYKYQAGMKMTGIRIKVVKNVV